MSSSLSFILDQVSKEKNIPREILIEAIESAMVTASKKKLGAAREIEASYDEESGEIELFEFVEVVEEVENSYYQISLHEALEIDPEAEIGDSLGLKLETDDFGRIAAQTAKQVIMQKIREAERESIYEEYHEKVGEIISGSVQRVERGNLIVNLGSTEAILPRSETIPRENFRQGERIRAYLLKVEITAKGPKIVLSRTHPGFLIRLFEVEVPEIFEGVIKIMGATREPGIRAKIAVSSSDYDVDPVGACVGVRGSRVQNVVQELKGEKIDIIRWNPDAVRYVCNAISPAEINKIILDEDKHTMEIVVLDEQLSLAIGRRGLNVRLAAKLTGWKLDVKSASRVASDFEQLFSPLADLEGFNNTAMELLYDNGFRKIEDIAGSTVAELGDIIGTEGVNPAQLIERAVIVFHALKEAAENPPPPPDEQVQETAQDTDSDSGSAEEGSESEEVAPENPAAADASSVKAEDEPVDAEVVPCTEDVLPVDKVEAVEKDPVVSTEFEE
ncbi:MAG: transcription termination/antitermination protein NusA [Deltaproteobacteria bacterium]|nr:transcription termination/antitermination protein NusA [Deltaproteobacteria bacterium]